MSRYVDVDATLETLKEFLIKTAINNVGYKRDVDKVCKDIADNRLSVWMEYVPAADVVEVVHGKWIKGVCDKCGFDWGKVAPIVSVPNYCPHCGARMDGGK